MNDHQSFLIKWIVIGIGASLFSYYLEPNPVLGASGVIMGMFSLIYLQYRKQYNMQGIFVLIVTNIIMGYMPGISLWGHAGGAFVGGVYYLIVKK